jgi:hypothetical protein
MEYPLISFRNIEPDAFPTRAVILSIFMLFE